MSRTAIVSAVRTPVGRIRGVLADVAPEKMAILVVKEAVNRAGIDPAIVDEVIYGNLYAHMIGNMGRYVALGAGLPYSVPGMTVDRRCGTSVTAISLADALIRAEDADVIVAGGCESDSNRPYVLPQQNRLHDMAAPAFRKSAAMAPGEKENIPMGITAENLAEKYGLTRQDCDAFAVASHAKATAAWDKGVFKSQIVPVVIEDKKKGTSKIVDTDEVFRRDCTMESLAKLKPAFKPDGVSTAGNSSPNSDGASAVLLMAEDKAKELGIKPLAYINGFSSVGVDPTIMGIGPVYATRKVFAKKGFSFDDIDVIEMNEAFAAQSLACIKELNMPTNKLNPNGGAIALGHPLAATGGVLVTKMVYELQRRGGGRGLVTFCCGGGNGVALIVETE